MYRMIPIYPLLSLPSLRNCLLAFVLGVLLAWLYSTGWLPAAVVTLFALSFVMTGVYLVCIAVGGKTE